MKLDWKYGLGLIVAIAGVAVPVWVWQADTSSKALKWSVISVTWFGASDTPTMKGLKLFYENQEIKNSALTVLEFNNTGSRPILASDFESAIEVKLKTPSKLMRVELANAIPKDLAPSITTRDGVALLNPLLLNPGDRFRVSVLSVDGLPSFEVRARIAGIKRLQFEDTTSFSLNAYLWRRRLLGAALAFAYFYLALGIGGQIRAGRFPVTEILVAIVSMVAAITLLHEVRGEGSVVVLFGGLGAVSVVAFLVRELESRFEKK